ncbi:hypothetical protein JXO59_10080 [candidate division KSB1 bacterium]|nr:hypothetical protein [candidate division KSB1 bacterium]
MTSRRKAILSLVSAFIIGFAFCFFLFYFSILEHHLGPRHGRDRTDDIMLRFTRELDLDARQQEFLKSELEKIRARHNEIRQANFSQFREIRDDFRRSFSTILTPEQKAKFDEYNRKRDEKFKR